MSPSALVAIEFALVIGVVLGLGIWQLVSVRREIARDRERDRDRQRDAQRSRANGDATPPEVPANTRPDERR